MANISYLKLRVITLVQNCPPAIVATPVAKGGPAGGARGPAQMDNQKEHISVAFMVMTRSGYRQSHAQT